MLGAGDAQICGLGELRADMSPASQPPPRCCLSGGRWEELPRAAAMLLCREQDCCASCALAAVLPARARARWYKLLTPRKGKRHV